MKTQFYTQNGYAGSNYSKYTNNKELAKLIREFIKKDNNLNKCKWSVTQNYLEINVALMEAPQEVYTESYKKERPNYENEYIQSVGGYNEMRINNYAKKIVEKITSFVESYYMDDSDGNIDYFNTNFYFRVDVGKYDRPFKIVKKETKKTHANKELEPINAGEVKLIEYSEKSFAIIGDTKPIKETLKNLGGSFNFRLHVDGDTVAGWIFSNKKKDNVKRVLNL